jgi:hypothetical protein
VVRHSDLLIAIWDGDREGGGLGGTAEIVAYAASAGVPVWWIHATEKCDPVWIDDMVPSQFVLELILARSPA